MNYYIDRSMHIPAYIQLYRYIAKDIADGIYTYGSRLPSKRTIAADTGVSLITVEHAMTLLLEEGYIESRPRSGYVIIYRSTDFQSVKAGGTSARKDGSSPGSEELTLRMGEFPFSVLSRTMRRVLLDYGERILVRSPNQGCPELRQAISAYLARSRGIKADPSRIIVGSGAEYLYGLAAQLLGRDTCFALEDPSYAKIRQVYEAMGVQCDMLEMSQEGIRTAELQRTRASVLHVTPFNSYPSGITAGISKRLEYLSWARDRGGVLIEDNYESELTISRKAEEPLFSMSPDVDVIYINTFSKTIAPSMRIGYMVLPERLAEKFNEMLGFYSCTVPVFEQYVIAELMESGDFERHVNRIRRRRRRDNQ